MMRTAVLLSVLLFAASPAPAQNAVPRPFDGTEVLMAGSAEMEIANDEALAQLFVELQDADLARAQSLVNQKAGLATAALKKADPSAQIESAGYNVYPIYEPRTARKVIGWRARQNINLRTGDMAALPKAIAAAQEHAALGGIDFRVSRALREKTDAELIQRAIANAQTKVGAAAAAMNVPAARIRIEQMNFGVAEPRPPIPIAFRAESRAMAADAVEQPSFEAGRSMLQANVTVRARFLMP